MKGYVNVSCIFLERGYLVFIRLLEKLVNLCLIQPSYLADLCIFRANRTQTFSVCFYLQEKGGLGKRRALSSGQLEGHWQSWEKDLVS